MAQMAADFYVDEPILVTASRKGPRYLTRDEYLKRFEEVIDQASQELIEMDLLQLTLERTLGDELEATVAQWVRRMVTNAGL